MTSPRCSGRLPTIPDSYLHKDAATFASAVGRSFYEQIMPSSSVNLGWSSWSIQWLSRVPSPIPDHIQVAYSADEDVRAAYARQAAHDWHEFVAFRGRELRRGGRLVVMTMAVDDDGEFGYRPMFAALLDTLDELRGADLVTEDELHRMCVPVVGRRKADFFAPFAPSGRFEQLEIDHLEVFDAEDRFWSQYQVDSDEKAFGAKWAAFVRASVFPTLATALDGGREDDRVAAVLRSAGGGRRRALGGCARADADPAGASGADQAPETVSLHDIVVDPQRITWRQSVTKPMRLNLDFDVVLDGDRLTGIPERADCHARRCRGVKAAFRRRRRRP